MSATFAAGAMVDRFEIVGVLGHGGMSTVYHARERGTDRHVVLKVPYDHLLGDPALYERFQRELAIGKTIDHPNIQKSIATGSYDGLPYTVMEYVDGEMLRETIGRRAPLSIAEAIGLTVQLCDALAYCHAHNVFHRDLKPENILVTPEGQVKVMDFGIALLQGARRVTFQGLSSVMGTPDYMAPEQIKGKRGDAATDIYALGVMLFEMLAGDVPYHGDNPFAIMGQHLNAAAPRLRSRNAQVSEALERVVARAMHRDPAQRYADAAQLAHDLTHLDSLDLSAFPPLDDALPTPRRQRLNDIARLTIALLVVVALLLAIAVLAQALHH